MKNLFVSFCLLLISASLIATDVSGDQSGTWDLAGSPYNIIGEISVPAGMTLEIEAGVEVIAMGDYKITAMGNIVAAGTVTDSIRFHGDGGLNWGGLRLENESMESHFDYCRISNTDDTNDYGIHSINSPVYIDHSYIDDHQKGIQFSALSTTNPSYMEIKNSKITNVQKSGITVVDNSNVLIDNCEVTQCGLGASFYGAIQLSLQSSSHSCSPTITNNYIHHNGKQGLTLANLFGYDNMAPTVNDNEVCYNYTGIYLYSGKGTYSRNHIHHNFVENDPNSGAGVMLYGSSANAIFTYNSIHHNYTGFYLTNDATVNLGDLNNAATDDDGYNCIYDNIFFDGTEYSVYNASASNVTAENTVWDDDPPIDVSIIDGNDNAAYGIVDYEPTLSPFAPPDSVSISEDYYCQPIGIAYPTYLDPIGWNLYIDATLVGMFPLDVSYYLPDFGLVPGQSYDIYVSYVYDGGESIYGEVSFLYNPLILNPPLNPEIAPMGLMTWEEPEPGSTSTFLYYNVYLDSLQIGNTTDLFWQYTGLVVGLQYLAKVSAVYEDGESELIAATWLPAIHNPPSNASYELFPDHIQLTWEAPVGSNVDLLQYQIFLDGYIYNTTNDLTSGIYGVLSGQNYFVELKALYVDNVLSGPVIFDILFVGTDDILNLETKLLGNYPNPFNPSTTISFQLNTSLRQGYAGQAETTENTELMIYNLKGQKIKVFTFPNGSLGTSEHSVVWDGTDQTGKPVSSGVYFYKLKAGDKSFSRKMLMMK
ncbi:MAG: right-handed parallel beta-helix repeat-containing protein [Candidatus Cloacimonadales bacterium]|nr:right-handed parallel beta-helix repeat-containing protein [Candidatus Cloacimonadales bacterium]